MYYTQYIYIYSIYTILNIYVYIGQLFFGNATLVTSTLETYLKSQKLTSTINNPPPPPILYIILDFTLVLAIDSSAAETLSKLYVYNIIFTTATYDIYYNIIILYIIYILYNNIYLSIYI